jgi:hypothetical protein
MSQLFTGWLYLEGDLDPGVSVVLIIIAFLGYLITLRG